MRLDVTGAAWLCVLACVIVFPHASWVVRALTAVSLAAVYVAQNVYDVKRRHNNPTFVLEGLPYSHYVEVARWALDRARVEYEERGTFPAFMFTLRGLTAPAVVYRGRTTLNDSQDVLDFLGARDAFFVRPESDDARRMEELASDTLGLHIRRYAYHHIFSVPGLFETFASKALPAWQVALAPYGLTAAARTIITTALRTKSAEGAEKSLERVLGVFAESDKLLSDGRPYLGGDEMCRSDIVFCSLANVLLLVPGSAYADRLCAMEKLPAAVQQVVKELRATKTGKYVARVLREEGRMVPSDTDKKEKKKTKKDQ